jgi:hypothetical protein
MTLSAIIPYLGTALAAVFALGMWQYQLITRRRYEVVEHALTAVGDAVQALHCVRRAEIDAKAEAEQHPDGLRPSPWHATYARIQGADTVFQNLRASTKSIAMHFGDSATAKFKELQAIHDKICAAQIGLYFRRTEEKIFPTPEQNARVEALKLTLSAQDENDPLTQQIDEIERGIQKQFSKYLRPSALRLFIPFWGWKP